MGENEQGGMLRTVVVVGLVALIALIITMGVVGMKASMTKNTDAATSVVLNTPKPYKFNDNDGYVKFASYTVNPSWNGKWYYLPRMGDVPAGYWRDVNIKFKVDQPSIVSFDINSYDYDRPGGLKPLPGRSSINDSDPFDERFTEIYDGSTPVRATDVKPGKVYEMKVRWHNDTPRTLYEGNNTSDLSALVVGTPDGSGGSFQVLELTGATYEKS